MDDTLDYQLENPNMSAWTVVNEYGYPRIVQRIKQYGTKKKTISVTYTLKKTLHGWKIIEIKGKKTIGCMDIREALEDWTSNWE
ncbi:MAG: hypothetical protein MRZ45_10295 [Blautia sp.]|nr:hypothetical protein [Blautia sp.]